MTRFGETDMYLRCRSDIDIAFILANRKRPIIVLSASNFGNEANTETMMCNSHITSSVYVIELTDLLQSKL